MSLLTSDGGLQAWGWVLFVLLGIIVSFFFIVQLIHCVSAYLLKKTDMRQQDSDNPNPPVIINSGPVRVLHTSPVTSPTSARIVRVSHPQRPGTTLVTTPPNAQSSTGNESNGRIPQFSLDDLNSFPVIPDFGENPCPICLDPLNEELVSHAKCMHLAHTSCLKQWLARDSLFACPVCRTPLLDSSSPERTS